MEITITEHRYYIPSGLSVTGSPEELVEERYNLENLTELEIYALYHIINNSAFKTLDEYSSELSLDLKFIEKVASNIYTQLISQLSEKDATIQLMIKK